MKTLVVVGLLLVCGCVIDEVREDDVGDALGCRAVAIWTQDWTAREDELLDAINDVRATGAMCGEDVRGPVPDLELAPALRCAARLHAAEQAEAGALSHDGNDGSTTLSRVDRAQYDGVPTHELLAASFLDPRDVVDAWVASPAECDALMSSRTEEFGAGFARVDDTKVRWVVLLGELRD